MGLQRLSKGQDGGGKKFTLGFWIEGGVEMEVEARHPPEALERARRKFSMREALKALDVVDLQVMERGLTVLESIIEPCKWSR